MRKELSILALLLTASLSAAAGSVFTNLTNKGQVKDGISLLERDRIGKKAEVDPLDALKDGQTFLKIGDDELMWKAVREQAELNANKGIQIPEGAAAKDIADMRRYSLKRSVSALMRRYLKNAIVAEEARKAGFKIEENQYREAVSNMVASFERKGEYGRKQAALLRSDDSLLAHNVRNVLLADRYRKERIYPQITVDTNEVRTLLAVRHGMNASVAASNRVYEAQIKAILKEIRSGKIEFAAAAEKYSECGSSQQGGLLGDVEFGGGMRPEWEAAARRMKPGEISGIVETPFSYHILRLEAFNFGDGDTVRSATTATGARISHILIEKAYLMPELTAEEAERMVKASKVAKTVDRLLNKTLAGGAVTCAIPLFSGSGDGKAKKAKEAKK